MVMGVIMAIKDNEQDHNDHEILKLNMKIDRGMLSERIQGKCLQICSSVINCKMKIHSTVLANQAPEIEVRVWFITDWIV